MENVLRCFSVVLLLTLVGCGSDAEPPEQGALNQPAEIDRTSTLATEPITNGDDTSSPKKPGGGNFPPTGNPMPRTGIIDAIAQAREAARRSTCKNNLKMIGLAMHNHHSVHGQFPAAASMSTDGKPLLSWRVQLLPFLGQTSLHKQFKLDEPWDSTHNKKLVAQMPAVFTCPSGNVKPGTTTYLGISGQQSVFNGSQKIRIRDMTDGTSNTLMVVDADDSRAVTWTKPGDFTYSTDNPTKGLVGHHDDGFQALFGDGSVKYISADITARMLVALFTRSGGEVVKLP